MRKRHFKMDGTSLDGKTIKVNEAQEKSPAGCFGQRRLPGRRPRPAAAGATAGSFLISRKLFSASHLFISPT
jgi:hypothetical protein